MNDFLPKILEITQICVGVNQMLNSNTGYNALRPVGV
jgi:hypothetical protein